MKWLELKSESDLNEITTNSFASARGVAIFKHSNRCSISFLAKKRVEASWFFEDELPIYLLDLLNYRKISDLVAEKFKVEHQSPQLLIIKNGECIHHDSHLSISVDNIKN